MVKQESLDMVSTYAIFFMKKQRNEGITLIALVVTIVVLLILAGITTTFVLGENGIINMAQRAAESTNTSIHKEQQELENVSKEIQNYLSEENNEEKPPILEEPVQEFSRSNGNIDVVFVNKSNNIINAETLPTPKIGGNMVPVKWNETSSSWYICKTTDNWYDYVNKQWANVMLRDGLEVEGISNSETATIEEMAGRKVIAVGSMFVYIPRYAYKIEYVTEDGSTVLGYSDSTGIVDIQGRVIPGTEKQEVTKVGNKYVLHPAFTINTANGGWKEDIEGIWVAKFEASSVEGNGNNTTTDNVTTKTIQVKPGENSWGNIDVNNIYINCENYNKELNSHMMKNSEWGAVVYLATSKYGKNEKISINDKKYTGGGTGTAYANSIEQSTTGNVYGIYDISGSKNEYLAAYVDNGYQTNYGASCNAGAPHFKNVYRKGRNDTQQENYEANKGKYGDAIYEISNNGNSNNGSWYGEYSGFPYSDTPFLHRGGGYMSDTKAGAFYFVHGTGDANAYGGFHLILITPQ